MQRNGADLTKFEGNAQGFRILNKNQYGLKLTFATLGAFTKYPCPALFTIRDMTKRSQKKFGFFQTEKEIFKEVAQSTGVDSCFGICFGSSSVGISSRGC